MEQQLTKDKAVEAGQKVTLLKPQMRKVTENYAPEELYTDWAEDRLKKGNELSVEPKYNGLRTCVLKSGDTVSVFFEDAKKERKQVFPDITSVLEECEDDFTLDGELVLFKDGSPLPRISMMKLLGSKPDIPEDEEAVIFLFDILYWEKDVHSLPLTKRRDLLEKFYKEYLDEGDSVSKAQRRKRENASPRHRDQQKPIDRQEETSLTEPAIALQKQHQISDYGMLMPDSERLDDKYPSRRQRQQTIKPRTDRYLKPTIMLGKVRHFELAEQKVVSSKESLFDAVEHFIHQDGSEGAMVKDVSSGYSLEGATSDWSKVKTILTLKVLVLKKDETETEGVYNYTCGVSVNA